MKHTRFLVALLIAGGVLFFPFVSQADEQVTSFQVSLVHPLQLFPDSYGIDGFRLNLIYGVNKDGQGLDLGLINDVRKDFKGVQVGLVNITERECDGVQLSLFNQAIEEMDGVQIGLINHTGSLRGIQLGILNFNDDTKYLGFFPFINAEF